MSHSDWVGLGLLIALVIGWGIQPYVARFAKWQNRSEPSATKPNREQPASPTHNQSIPKPPPNARDYGPDPVFYPYSMRSVMEQRHGTLSWGAPFTLEQWDQLKSGARVHAILHSGDPGPDGTKNRSRGNPETRSIRHVITEEMEFERIRINGSPEWANNSGVHEPITHVSVWWDKHAQHLAYQLALKNAQIWNDNLTFTLTSLTVELGIQWTPHGFKSGAR